MTYGIYEVIGRREYRGHAPGQRFTARLEPAAAARAIQRRDIRLVGQVTPTIDARNITFASGWIPQAGEGG